MGQSYLLGCPEGGEQRMLEAVEKVDYRHVQDPRRGQGEGARPHRGAGRAEPGVRRGRAQRAAAPAAAAARFAPSDLTAKNGNGNGDGHAAADPRLAGVLQRLDRALGNDGRLL